MKQAGSQKVSTRQRKQVAVIGAGPAGLAAAYKLCEQGTMVDVFEAGDAVGGMAKTISLWGQQVDLGPHRFFSSDVRINTLWLDILGDQYEMVKRLTRIYYNGQFFAYPLGASNALSRLGIANAAACVLSYAWSKVKPLPDETTFEGWVSNRFGARLYDIFFRSYSEKLWGIPCRELDADFAAQRIKKFSLFEAVKVALIGARSTKHKTLVDEFAYPRGGAGALYIGLQRRITKMGGTINLNSRVTSVQPGANGKRPSLLLPDGTCKTYDHIISTMPITLLIREMDTPAVVQEHARCLTFRNTLLVYLRLECPSPFPDQWIYVHSPELGVGRITNFRNWVKAINNEEPHTIVCLEYWCNDSDSLWTNDPEAMIALATKELYATRLVPGGTVLEGHVVRVPRCYPVYRRGYQKHLKAIVEFLDQYPAITVIGRYGAFKYNNQDHSILMGLLAADNIASGTAHSLWDVNTDYEYQEASRLTATGLERDAS